MMCGQDDGTSTLVGLSPPSLEVVVSGSRQHDHARVGRGLGGGLQLLYQVLSELLSEASPNGLVGAPRDRAYVASIGGGRPHGGGNAPEIVASPVDPDVRGSARRDEISGGGHLDVHRDFDVGVVRIPDVLVGVVAAPVDRDIGDGRHRSRVDRREEGVHVGLDPAPVEFDDCDHAAPRGVRRPVVGLAEVDDAPGSGPGRGRPRAEAADATLEVGNALRLSGENAQPGGVSRDRRVIERGQVRLHRRARIPVQIDHVAGGIVLDGEVRPDGRVGERHVGEVEGRLLERGHRIVIAVGRQHFEGRIQRHRRGQVARRIKNDVPGGVLAFLSLGRIDVPEVPEGEGLIVQIGKRRRGRIPERIVQIGVPHHRIRAVDGRHRRIVAARIWVDAGRYPGVDAERAPVIGAQCAAFGLHERQQKQQSYIVVGGDVQRPSYQHRRRDAEIVAEGM